MYLTHNFTLLYNKESKKATGRVECLRQSEGQISQRVPIHETLAVGMLLSVVGGFLESYTYMLRGGVFCNGQTGNLVLMIISLVEGEIHRALYYPVPIVAFVLGIMLTNYMHYRLTGESVVAWIHILLAIEIVVLFFIGLVPLHFPNALANVPISFICSIQYHTFRQLKGAPYASTFCTNNLRLVAENLYRCCVEKERGAGMRALRYLAIIGIFLLGTATGALLARPMGQYAVWICCGLLTVVLIITLCDDKQWHKKVISSKKIKQASH